MTRTYISENEIREVVRGFESCATGKDDFSHHNHLAVAVWYLRQDPEQALNLMRTSLQRFLNHYDCHANYHETLTRFWLLRVQSVLETFPADSSLVAATNAVIASLGNSRLAFEFYSREVVESEDAKQRGVEPDLKAL